MAQTLTSNKDSNLKPLAREERVMIKKTDIVVRLNDRDTLILDPSLNYGVLRSKDQDDCIVIPMIVHKHGLIELPYGINFDFDDIDNYPEDVASDVKSAINTVKSVLKLLKYI